MLGQCSVVKSKLSRIKFNTVTVTTTVGTTPLAMTVPIIVMTTVLLLQVDKGTGVGKSTTVTLVSAASLTINIVIVSLAAKVGASMCGCVFKDVLTVDTRSIGLDLMLSIFILVLFVIFCRGVFTVAFSRAFTHTANMGTKICGALVTMLATMAVILKVHVVKTLLVSDLVVFPTLASVEIYEAFGDIVVGTTMVSIIYLVTKMALSCITTAPTKTDIILTGLMVVILCAMIKTIGGRVR